MPNCCFQGFKAANCRFHILTADSLTLEVWTTWQSETHSSHLASHQTDLTELVFQTLRIPACTLKIGCSGTAEIADDTRRRNKRNER